VGQDLHRDRFFPLEFGQFFVPFLDFFVQRLVLDFQLLEVDHVQAVGELLAGPMRAFELL
jgi:hypothetical protein